MNDKLTKVYFRDCHHHLHHPFHQQQACVAGVNYRCVSDTHHNKTTNRRKKKNKKNDALAERTKANGPGPRYSNDGMTLHNSRINIIYFALQTNATGKRGARACMWDLLLSQKCIITARQINPAQRPNTHRKWEREEETGDDKPGATPITRCCVFYFARFLSITLSGVVRSDVMARPERVRSAATEQHK